MAAWRQIAGRRKTGRGLLVLIHRGLGLATAGFLLLAGLTGSLLAFNDELEVLISPELFRAPPATPGARPLDPLVLRERVQANHPQALVRLAPLTPLPGRALVFHLRALPDPATDKPPALLNDQVFVDPYSGDLLGERRWGDLSQGMKNLMPFIYRLHFALALDSPGEYLMGVIALLWTLDCFLGAWLTLPAQKRNKTSAGPRRSWLARWRPAWRLRWTRNGYPRTYDLHRAGGLWPWAMLLVLAWSGVAMNLREVYDPVMGTLFATQPLSEPAVPSRPLPQPPIDWFTARDIGRHLMRDQAQQQDFDILAEFLLSYDPVQGMYRYSVRSDRDVADHWGDTSVSFSAVDGRYLALWLPTGAASGDTIRSWLTNLHRAALGGVPFKLFIGVVGGTVAMLAVTGVVIWGRKRQARKRVPS